MLGIKRTEEVAKEELSVQKPFVKSFIDPGIREIKIMDFDVFRTIKDNLLISALCEEPLAESLGDNGRDYGGLLGNHKATGRFGKVFITSINLTSPEKGMDILSSDTTAIATTVGKLDEASKISFEKPEDTEQLVINYLKALLPVIKDKLFVSTINGSQNGKYDNLQFNRGYIKPDKIVNAPAWLAQGKSLPTAISTYKLDDVESIDRVEEGVNVTHTLSIKGQEGKSYFNKKEGVDTWNYSWEDKPSTEIETVPSGIIPSMPDMELPGDDDGSELSF